MTQTDKQRQQHREAQARYRERHPGKVQAYYDANPTYRNDQRWKFKLKLIEMLGGCCVHCQITDPRLLEFDHIDPTTKDFAVNYALSNLTQALTLSEAKKCRLLCANCHRLVHTKY